MTLTVRIGDQVFTVSPRTAKILERIAREERELAAVRPRDAGGIAIP